MVQGNWIVWDGTTKVAEGTVRGSDGSGETVDERELGYFTAPAKGNYTVEMTFTKDGGPLKSMSAHLVVRQDYDFWCGPM
jgi:hypothetical protein